MVWSIFLQENHQLRASKFVQLTILSEFFFSCYLTLFFRVHPRPIVLGLPAVTAHETQWNERLEVSHEQAVQDLPSQGVIFSTPYTAQD